MGGGAWRLYLLHVTVRGAAVGAAVAATCGYGTLQSLSAGTVCANAKNACSRGYGTSVCTMHMQGRADGASLCLSPLAAGVSCME